MNSRHLGDLFEASWLKPRVSCHFPSKRHTSQGHEFPSFPQPVRTASMLLVGSDSPPEGLGSTESYSEIEGLNDLDGPLL